LQDIAKNNKEKYETMFGIKFKEIHSNTVTFSNKAPLWLVIISWAMGCLSHSGHELI